MKTWSAQSMGVIIMCRLIGELIDNIVFNFFKLRVNIRRAIQTVCFSSVFCFALVILLFFLMRQSDVIVVLDPTAMFAMAVGSITYINIIIGFWNSKTPSNKDSSNLYLGRNLDTYRIHNNNWIQLLNNSPLKCFFILEILIPGLLMLTEVFSGLHIFKNFADNKLCGWLDSKAFWIIDFIRKNAEDIRRLWMSVFILIAFISTVSVIEIIIIYRFTFIRNKIKSRNNLTKMIIEIDIKDFAQRSTKNLFSILSIYHYHSDYSVYLNQVYNVINNHFDEAESVCKNISEYYRFLDLSFFGEESAMDNILTKVTKSQKRGKIYKNLIEMIHFYYWNKWKICSTKNIPLLIVIKMAKRDINVLTSLESKLSSDEHYNCYYWGNYNGISGFADINGDTKCNTNIAQIVDALSTKFYNVDLRLDKELDPDYSDDSSMKENVDRLFCLLDDLLKLNDINNRNMCVLHKKNALECVLDPLCTQLRKLSAESSVRHEICSKMQYRSSNEAYKDALMSLW